MAYISNLDKVICIQYIRLANSIAALNRPQLIPTCSISLLIEKVICLFRRKHFSERSQNQSEQRSLIYATVLKVINAQISMRLWTGIL